MAVWTFTVYAVYAPQSGGFVRTATPASGTVTKLDGTALTVTQGGSSVSRVTADSFGGVQFTVNRASWTGAPEVLLNLGVGALNVKADEYGDYLASIGRPIPLLNATDATMRRWTDALARQIAGLGAARLGCYGDSITDGYWTNVPSMYSNSWPRRLQAMADRRYGAAGDSPVQFYDNDMPGLSFVIGGVGSITTLTGYGWFGQQARQIQNPGATFVTYVQLGPVQCDTFRLTAIGNAGTTEAAVKIDGGAITNYSTIYSGGGNRWVTIDVPAGSLGQHTIQVSAGPSATNLYLVTIEPIIGGGRTSGNGVKVFRCAKGGATPAQLIDTGSDAGGGSLATAFDAFAPDMSIIWLGVNNYLVQSVDVATYKSQMLTLIQRAKRTGDVMLLTEVPNSDQTKTPSQADFDAAVRDLAFTQGCALLDVNTAWATYASANARGYMGDATHPGQLGYGAIAQAIGSALFL